MNIIVGCPVSRRAWSLPRWFDHVENAFVTLGVEPQYLFVGDPVHDPATFAIINDRAPDAIIVEVNEGRDADFRDWSTDRKELMVSLRNLALVEVRARQPDYYLSLDSDILLHRGAVGSYLDALTNPRWGAVGGKCYMSAGRACPSYLMGGRAGNWRRPDVDVPSLFEVDVIMAIKMMGPAAYAINYRYHKQGEDIGWSRACAEQSVRFGWDARVVNKHVMEPEHLDRHDPRCGF